MLKEIKEIKEIKELKTQFFKVFKGTDPFTDCLKDTVEKKLIVFPTDGYYLTSEQFFALVNTAMKLGDSEIFISEVESRPDPFVLPPGRDYQHKHWVAQIPLKFSQYTEMPIILENAIYSPKGKWGIIVSHEEHAILGGPNEFIREFKAYYGTWKDDLGEFLEFWEWNKNNFGSNLDWLPELMKHLV